MADRRPPSFDVPDQGDEPLVWDPQRRTFVPAPASVVEETSAPSTAGRWYVGADAVGKAPPPRDGAAAGGTTVAAPPVETPPRRAEPLPRPAMPPNPASPPSAPKTRRRRRFLRMRRPKLRWILAFAGLTPLLLVLAGWIYANQIFGEVRRVPVGEVLDPIGGGGTNYLIVGSDSREVGSSDPNVQPGGEAPTGQRSDTMLILRITPDGSRTMSIPRDLFVTDAADGSQGRINGAYAEGPANLIRTVQQNLRVPVHRYIEVDFVTFSSLVDALDGITLGPDIVPHPATDDRSGLNISAGPVTLDGQQALAFVRSRHYTELIDGQLRTDPTGDLGRVNRQQAFLRKVLAEAGASRNPVTLLRIASSVADGLRIDDHMSLIDAVRFAWNMGRLSPESAVLPTVDHRTGGGAAVLLLDDERATEILDLFR